MSSDSRGLRELTEELEHTAGRLRAHGVAPEEAAALVERCAELAGQITASLEREARELSAQLPFEDAPEQERLL